LVQALRRIALTLPLLLVVSFVVFLVGELLPGDPAAERFDVHANPQAVAEWRARKGLDRPLLERYGSYVAKTATLDFGESYVDDRKIGPALRDRFAATVELSLFALMIAVPIGLVAGVISASLRGRWIDYAANSTALVGISLPVFWLGMLLVLLAKLVGWNHFQSRFDVREFEDVVGAYSTKYYLFESIARGQWAVAESCIQHLLVPALALSTIPMATITRMTRSSVLEEIGSDYVRTARAKGVSRGRAIVRHALRNALLPIVTVIGLQAGTLLSGAALTETVFSWPGLGTFIVDGVKRKDSPALTGGLILVATTFILVNLAVDLLYGVLDPRIRSGADV
jgi:ABC-type dipeptide/oligopeptide/nickel transport system permease component